MKLGSKRGAALAYVIVITAALMILAAALVFTAKFNIDSSRNSLEGRQAYLDAKSAIEYGKAYLKNKPDSGDFTILYDNGASGFKLGTKDDKNPVAVYCKNKKVINAAGKYKSSGRVRRLGCKFRDKKNTSFTTEFLAAGAVYGENRLYFNWLDNNELLMSKFLNKETSSAYPVAVSHTIQALTGTCSFTAPQLYLLGVYRYSLLDEGYSLMSQPDSNLTVKTDMIYIKGNLFCIFSGHIVRPPTFTLKSLKGDSGVIIFENDCKILKSALGGDSVIIKRGCYSFDSGVDLYSLSNAKASDNYKYNHLHSLPKVPDDVNINQDAVGKPSKICSGDSILENGIENGVGWSTGGEFYWYNKLSYKISDDRIYHGSLIIKDDKDKIIYWYLQDTENWERALLGDYFNVSDVYQAKKISLRYVNSDKDFVVPSHKTVVFKADKISLSTEYSDTEVGDSSDDRPRIKGNSTRFILEAWDKKKAVELYVPNDITVQYNNNYEIKAGYYDVTQLNLFSDKAKQFFENPENNHSPSGVDVTGGVYTDGQ